MIVITDKLKQQIKHNMPEPSISDQENPFLLFLQELVDTVNELTAETEDDG